MAIAIVVLSSLKVVMSINEYNYVYGQNVNDHRFLGPRRQARMTFHVYIEDIVKVEMGHYKLFLPCK